MQIICNKCGDPNKSGMHLLYSREMFYMVFWIQAVVEPSLLTKINNINLASQQYSYFGFSFNEHRLPYRRIKTFRVPFLTKRSPITNTSQPFIP